MINPMNMRGKRILITGAGSGIAPIRPLSMTKAENVDLVMRVNSYSFVEIVRVLTKTRNGF